MKWSITYYNDKVQQEVFSLPKTLLARYLRTTDLMLKLGPCLGEPHTKSFGKGLFEVRVKAQEGIARILFCTLIGQEIVILHSFIKKTQKTPLREIEIARKRLLEIKDETL